jgi:hypothetical protein
MDRKARSSALFGPSSRSGTGCGRPTGRTSPTGHTHHQLGRADPEFRPSATACGPSASAVFNDGLSPARPVMEAVTAKCDITITITTKPLDKSQ